MSKDSHSRSGVSGSGYASSYQSSEGNDKHTSRSQERLSSSYWVEDGTEASFPKLDVGHDTMRTEIVVVGGGIFGVTVAALLHREDRRVMLIEGDRIGRGTTGFSTAKLTANHKIMYSSLKKKHGAHTAKVYAEIQQAGIKVIRELLEEYGIECQMEPRDHVTFATDDEQLTKVRLEYDAAREAGLDVEYQDTVRDLPRSIQEKGAMVCHGDWAFNPYAYTVGLAKAIARQGAQVFENSRVVDVHDRSDPCVVDLDAGGHIAADVVVVATHLPILDRSLHFAFSYPDRTYCAAFKMKPGKLAPENMYISAEDEPGSRSFRSELDRSVLIVAGEGHVLGSERDTEGKLHALEVWARHHFHVDSLINHWTAFDYIAADSLPYMGRLTRGTNAMFTATGFQKWGLSNGAGAAILVTDLIQGRVNPWEAVVDAARPNPVFRGLAGWGKVNGHVLKHFMGDLRQ